MEITIGRIGSELEFFGLSMAKEKGESKEKECQSLKVIHLYFFNSILILSIPVNTSIFNLPHQISTLFYF